VVEKEVPKYIEMESEEEEVVEREVVQEEEVKVIKNVEIEDNRPLYKKGLNFITGGVIFGAGVLLSRPRAGSVAMIMIILALIGYFGRGKIKKLIEKIREKREGY